MRIPTRVALGSGVVIALLAAVTVYEAATISRLAAMQRALGEETLPSTALTLDLLASRDRLEKHVLKFAATRDRAYAAAAAEAARRFSLDLDRLVGLEASGEEGRAVRDVALAWGSFPLATATDAVDELAVLDQGELADRLGVPLDELRLKLVAVVAAAREEADQRVAQADRAAIRARSVSLTALVVAVLLAFAVTVFTVRSIQRPLARLTAATEALARGRFDHRVDVRGHDELAMLGRRFNSMAERLGELDRLKRDLLSHVSHEIKTPLAAMSETTQLLLDDIPGPLTAKQRRLLELQRESERRLQGMIGNLLDLSRIEAGVMDYRFGVHGVRPVLVAALEEFEALARDRGVRFELDAPDDLPPVRCDPDRLLQVVHNLVSNAIRVSPDSGTVTVAACAHSGGSANRLEIRVRDRGPGIPDEEKARLFQPFYQVPGCRSRDRSGVGLGLAICREIVATHAGTIRVEDAPDHGAVFVVELACERSRPANAPGRESVQ